MEPIATLIKHTTNTTIAQLHNLADWKLKWSPSITTWII